MNFNPPFSLFSPEEQRIFNKFPKMFRQADLPMTETCMCWGLDIPERWYFVIEELAGYINEIAPDCIEFTDVKIKWKGLRVGFDFVREIEEEKKRLVYELIDEAESLIQI